MGTMVAASLGLHLCLGLGLWGLGLWDGALVPKPQQVIKARLVRLGPSRDKNLLPTLAAAQKTAAVPRTKPPTPAQVPVPAAPAAQTPKSAAPAAAEPTAGEVAAGAAARTQSVLERLRKQAAGVPDGDQAGDADDAMAGDRYIALVERCMKREFVIEGAEFKRVANRQALALVRIAASGKVIDFRLKQSSGLTAFDQAVARAVRACGEVPPPPTDRREQLRRAGIIITFRP